MRVLLFKSFILGLSWLILPFWAFLALSVYFYLVPFFQPFKLIIPFMLALAVAFAAPHGFWFAILIGMLFFLLLGIKNLILIHRFDNHQMMVFLILFLLFFSFFFHFQNWQRWIVSLISLGVGLSYFFLFDELADYIKIKRNDEPKKIFIPLEAERPKALVALAYWRGRSLTGFISGLGAFFLWQVVMAVLFLPLNYFYQTALLFLFSVILTDFLLEYLGGGISRKKILTDFSIFFVIAVIMLASANWGL